MHSKLICFLDDEEPKIQASTKIKYALYAIFCLCVAFGVVAIGLACSAIMVRNSYVSLFAKVFISDVSPILQGVEGGQICHSPSFC